MAGGFKRKVYMLVFEGDYEGLVVRARGVSIDRAVGFVALGTALARGILADTDEGKKQREKLYQALAAVLIDWNYEEDDGTPVPASIDGIRSADWDLVLEVFQAWSTAVMGVERPLASSSNGGGPSAEASIPMDVLSPSPSS